MRMEHPLLRFRLAFILLAIVIAVGVAGYMLINGWNFLDSFYMVIITISTVGYTEVHPQGVAGRMFSSGLIVVGVATMLYGFGVFAETLADNAFGRYRRERRLQRDLDHLRDHYIICGYGRIGTQIVAEFEDHKVPYVVIYQTQGAVERIRAEELVVSPATAAIGKTLEASGLLAGDAARVLALRRRDGNLHVNPSGSLRLEEGDLVIALGTEEQLFVSASVLR